jgi:hypothetical protein
VTDDEEGEVVADGGNDGPPWPLHHFDNTVNLYHFLATHEPWLFRAILAIYRLQTGEERALRQTKRKKREGFAKKYAYDGSQICEELLNGGAVLQDLNQTNIPRVIDQIPRATNIALSIAHTHKKQLIAIYNGTIDAFFSPPPPSNIIKNSL